MANYTEHYQLHQWEGSDPFLRTDFNEDLEKIDNALNQKVAFVSGSYVGNATDMENSCVQPIELGFQPKAVLVWGIHIAEIINYDRFYQAFATNTTGFSNILMVTDNGFAVGQYCENGKVLNPNLNFSEKIYLYIAWY